VLAVVLSTMIRVTRAYTAGMAGSEVRRAPR
jgi:hypothetical protein